MACGYGIVVVFASRECNPDGTWWTVPNTNRTWSDYTTCINIGDLEVSYACSSKCCCHRVIEVLHDAVN